jgi:hypothetical protein
MSDRALFKVPVLPYLKKYMVKQFFAGHKSPFKIEEDTLLGKQFMSLIIDARKIDFIDKHLEMSAVLEIVLSDSMRKRSPRISKLVCINKFADKLFKNDLIVWILAAEYFGIRPFPSSKAFLEHYSIDESEYSHDAAYKHWTRTKNGDFKNKSRTYYGKLRKKGWNLMELKSSTSSNS